VSAALAIRDDDHDDAWRVQRAQQEARRSVMTALVCLDPRLLRPRDREFVDWACRASSTALDEGHAARVDRLAWRYRRLLPAHLAPRVDPDDPLVRAEALEVTAGA
jgi:hypothetical protein